jgi:hypothetical protein
LGVLPAKNHVRNTPKATAPTPPPTANKLKKPPVQKPSNAIAPDNIMVTPAARPETRARAT